MLGLLAGITGAPAWEFVTQLAVAAHVRPMWFGVPAVVAGLGAAWCLLSRRASVSSEHPPR